MRRIIFFIALFGFSAAYAQQQFYAFGPKKGQPVESEEDKRTDYQQQSLQQLQSIQALLKTQQESSAQQLELLKQQNQLLNTVVQFQQQQIQQQAAQQLQQQPAVPLLQPQQPAQ